jgi:nitrogen regulatory protein P-II 1
MVKIEAVIQPFKLDEVKAMLEALRVEDIRIWEVRDHSSRAVRKAVYRGGEYLADTPKVKLEMLVSSLRSDEVVEAVLRVARTNGPDDDGTVVVFEVAEAVRIKNGQRIHFALS